MVNKILAVLNYEELFYCLEENGAKEAEKFTWESAALKCLNLYQALLK
ncbi:hypothetical protein FJ208_00675 [Candidatus Gribaldobacteria bacterium]|nr:hypothetical protein [Candidatus Gribaldobacteria bacterium]